jgi:hypothetical protein
VFYFQVFGPLSERCKVHFYTSGCPAPFTDKLFSP